MPFLEGGLITLLKTLSFFFDVFTYIPYYIIQEQGKIKRQALRVKAELVGGPDGYWKSSDEDELSNTPDSDCHTLPELFEKAAIQYKDDACLGTREFFREEDELQANGKVFKKCILGEYEWKTYAEVLQEVKELGRGLTESGMSPTKPILIFAETRADWMIAAQACFRQNFTVVTLYATLGDEAIIHGINETQVTHVITSGDLLPKFKKLLPKISSLQHITYMKGRYPVNPSKISEGTNVTVSSMQDIINLGQTKADSYVDTLPLPSDVAVIMYTSGATGIPKGVQIAHTNIMAAVSGLLDRAKLRHGDTYVGYLPLAHILELAAEISCLYAGCRIGYSSPNTLSDASTAIKKGSKGDVSILKPSLMACVPMVMDRIYKSVWDKVNTGTLVKRVLFKFAVDYKRKWIQRGGDTPLLNALIMSNIKNLLGGNLRAMVSGGAPLNSATQEFLRLCLCCPVIQGYGLTETCAAGTVGDLADISSGHVGQPVTSCRLKLLNWEEGNYRNTDDPPSGEVWIGGPTVAIGYYKNLQKTREDFVEQDGTRWFKTGDIGSFKKDGSLQIVDRKKDLVKLQAGEYVSLGKVEACLKLCPVLDNICVFASSQHMFTVAVVVPSPKALQELADSLSVKGDWESLCKDDTVKNAVLKQVQQQGAKGGLEKFEIPKNLYLTADMWTPDTGLVTDSLKLKRKPLSDKYRHVIQKMYQ